MVLRVLVAAVLVLHGAIHAIGFAAPWRLALLQGIPDPSVAFFGRLHLGDSGARALGLVWLAVAFAFVVAAAGLLAGAPWAVTVTLVAAIASSGLCVVGSPAALPGVVVNVLVLLLFGYAWLAGSALRALQ